MRFVVSVAVTLAAAAALYGVGWLSGRDSANAAHRASQELIRETADAVEMRTAERISQIRVVHQTITGQVREVIRENEVYRDCELDEPMRRLLDAARRGDSEPAAGGGGLPAIGSSSSP